MAESKKFKEPLKKTTTDKKKEKPRRREPAGQGS
jgi:hypothetical protein